MPSQLITNDSITFICARNFTYAGEDYELGTDFPQDKARDIDTLVRARYIIPVVDDRSDKPRTWHREVRERDLVLQKLGVSSSKETPEEVEDSEEAFEVHAHTIPEIEEYADENPDELENLIEAEESGLNRSTLLKKLYDRLEARDE